MLAQLYLEIGQFKVELDCSEKRVDPAGAAQTLIEPTSEPISVARQCELLDMPCSTWYRHPQACLAAQCRRLAALGGAKQAAMAVAHTLIVMVFTLLT